MRSGIKKENMHRVIKKKLFTIGIGVFIISFILIYVAGSQSLPRSSNEMLIEDYDWPFVPVGGDSVRIQDDLIFFWPLVFTKNYYEDGNYYWSPINSSPTKHPLVLLYWGLASIIISLIVLIIIKKLLKKK